MQPDIEACDPWHPRDAAACMAGVDFPWFVAGGWAIELFLGTRTREHEDLEIAVASSLFEKLPPRFSEFDFWVPQGERKLAPMSTETLAGEWHQTWAYERAAQVWRFDVFREPHDGDTWICRRGTTIRLPYPEVFEVTADGIPYLRPEIVRFSRQRRCGTGTGRTSRLRCPECLPRSVRGYTPRPNGCIPITTGSPLRNESRLIMHRPFLTTGLVRLSQEILSPSGRAR